MAPTKINIKERLTDGEIDLSMSDIKDVPVKDIATITKAFSLDLSNNRIITLPVTFATLTHLTRLDLSKNQLTELPDNFGDLVRLKFLDLYQNRIEYLPVTFATLKALRWLDLKDNPLVPAVAKVAGQCLDAKQCQDCARNVVNFFLQIQEHIDANRHNLRPKIADKAPPVTAPKKMDRKAKKKETKPAAAQAPKKSPPPKQGQKKQAKKAANEPKCTKCAWTRLFLVFVTLGLLAVFVLTSIGCECTKPVETLVVSWYAKGLEALPAGLQGYALQGGAWTKFAHQKTGNLTLEAVQYVKNKENLVNAYKSLADIIGNLLQQVKEQYKKLVS